MKVFSYVGKNKDGELVNGEIEAENEMAASRVLTSRDVAPITISGEMPTSFNFFNRVSLKEKVLIVRQLATMINAGLPIAQALKTIEMQNSKASIKKLLSQTTSDIEGGSQLSVAFSRFPEVFSQLDVTLIASGETSGSLDKALLRMADQLEKQQSLMRKVRGALVYPAFILVVVVAVVVVMIVYVMPQMDGLYQSFGAKLPFLTRFFIAAGKVLGKIGPLVILALIGLSMYVYAAIKRPFGRKIWDNFKLHLYAINTLLVKMYMARFARTLSGLVSSGVPLLDSLNIVSKAIGNVVYQDIVVEAAEKVKSGIALSEALKENPEFPAVVPQMIAVGEKTGELDNMLSNLADYYEEEVDVAVKSISGLIEPIIIVVLGGTVAVILVAIMLPIYQIGKIV
jgi:type IV pilus assembly protein PilC